MILQKALLQEKHFLYEMQENPYARLFVYEEDGVICGYADLCEWSKNLDEQYYNAQVQLTIDEVIDEIDAKNT